MAQQILGADLSIGSGVIADLGTFTTHTAASLHLNNIVTACLTFGGTVRQHP